MHNPQFVSLTKSKVSSQRIIRDLDKAISQYTDLHAKYRATKSINAHYTLRDLNYLESHNNMSK